MSLQLHFSNINSELERISILATNLQKENRSLKKENTDLKSKDNCQKKLIMIKELLDYSKNNLLAANEFRQALTSILKE